MTIRDWLALPETGTGEDYGFFGPDSVTLEGVELSTSLSIGFQRAVVIEELDPALVAAVDKTHEIYSRPRTRYDRTLRYFAMVAFDDSRSTYEPPTFWSRSTPRPSAPTRSRERPTTPTTRIRSCGST